MFGKTPPAIGSNQNVGADATAMQAGRDIHYHSGLTLADAQTLFNYLLESNFPKLQAAADATARSRINDFANTFSNDVKDGAARILVEKLTDPDVQAAMNEAVQACARRGEASSPEILSKLLVHRLEDNTPFVDMVISEAVSVAPKLSKEQISFLVYVHVCKGFSFTKPSYTAFENVGKAALPLIQSGLGLSRTQKLHMQYVGVLSLNPLVGIDVYDTAFKSYGEKMGVKTIDNFKDKLEFYSPSYNYLLQRFEENHVYEPDLTSVGYAIAITVLRQFIPIEFSIWLK